MRVNELMNVNESTPWERRITIRTPENLELSYDLAGAGTRAAAYLLDIVLIVLLSQLLANLFVALFLFIKSAGEAWAAAIIGLLMFLFINGYFIVFEWLMNGQTPGKRAVGIRVIKEGGYALRFIDTLLRNVMRAIDFLPLFYGVGLVSLLFTPRSQRLGDLVAGTLLVRRLPIQTESLLPESLQSGPSAPPMPAAQLALLPNALLESCVDFFRILPELAPRYRQELSMELVDLVQETTGLAWDRSRSAEGFLASIIQQSGQIGPWSSSSPEQVLPLS
jgi:uncharacterized RDD family membrane protein YckC